MNILLLIILLLIIYNCCKISESFKDKNVKYYLADSEIIMDRTPSTFNFIDIRNDTTKIYIPDHTAFNNKHLYKNTSNSDRYLKYVRGITALNEEINNKYKNTDIKENKEYCNISQKRNISLMSNNNNSKRLDSFMINENIYDY